MLLLCKLAFCTCSMSCLTVCKGAGSEETSFNFPVSNLNLEHKIKQLIKTKLKGRQIKNVKEAKISVFQMTNRVSKHLVCHIGKIARNSNDRNITVATGASVKL